jgi:hypothetical protein
MKKLTILLVIGVLMACSVSCLADGWGGRDGRGGWGPVGSGGHGWDRGGRDGRGGWGPVGPGGHGGDRDGRDGRGGWGLSQPPTRQVVVMTPWGPQVVIEQLVMTPWGPQWVRVR